MFIGCLPLKYASDRLLSARGDTLEEMLKMLLHAIGWWCWSRMSSMHVEGWLRLTGIPVFLQSQLPQCATVCHSVPQCHSVGAATCTSIQQLHQSEHIHPQQDVHCILHNVQAACCTLHMTGNQLPDSLQSTFIADCHVHQMHWRAPNELECSANADIWVGKPPPMH